jgi:putative DNA primase/helicase
MLPSSKRVSLADLRPTVAYTGSPTLIRISSVEAESVEWLWWRRLPLGKVVVLDGDPGLGKSTLTLDVAARVSAGREMPDGHPGVAGGAGVVVLSAEDGLADTIRPRLEAAGADLERVATFKLHDENGSERLAELPADIPAIGKIVRELGARLLIVDPLMAYLAGEVNSHRDQDVRRALAPLAELAERERVTVIVVRHLNKTGSGSPIYRGGGSIGIIGAARVGLLVAEYPNDKERRVLAPVKTNLSAPPPSLAYRLVEARKDVARVEWEGVAEVTAAQLLVLSRTEESAERGALGEAEDFLSVILANGPLASKQIMAEARGAGISERTLHRAKRELGIRAIKTEVQGGWEWVLDEGCQSLASFEDCHETPKVANPEPWQPSANGGSLRRLPSNGNLGKQGTVTLVQTQNGDQAAWQLQREDGVPVGAGLFASPEAAVSFAHSHFWEVLGSHCVELEV